MMPSATAEQIIKTAQECFALDLIDEHRLKRVTEKALTQVGYDPILDLPFRWEIAHERALRRKQACKGWFRRLLRGNG